MTAAYNYLGDLSLRLHSDSKALVETRENIARLKARIASDQSNLDAAEQYETVLTKAIASGQQLLDEEWQEDWKVGRAPGEQPIEHKAMAATARTQGFPVMQVAMPIMKNGSFVCDWAGCGQDLIGSDAEGWVHAETSRVECHPEPPAPALQEGLDGDPNRRTVLPPHIAEQVRTDG